MIQSISINTDSRLNKLTRKPLTITEDEHINDTEGSASSINTLTKLALG